MGWAGRVARGAGCVVVVAAALWPMLSCRQIVGIGDTPPGASSPTPACGFTWSSSDCASCVQSSCCTQATACGKEATCKTAFDCVAACGGDEECRAGCIHGGDATMAALGACQSRACASACDLTCGGWGLLPGPQLAHIEQNAGCESCLTSAPSCAQLAACVGDESCLLSRFCGNACLDGYDLQCTSACGYPAPQFSTAAGADSGSAALSNQQLLGLCVDACKPGTNWSCVSKESWPPASKPTVTYRFNVYDFTSGDGLRGVQVRACSVSDPASCIEAAASVTSGASGVVAISLPSDPPFDGYLELSLTGYVTYLAFINPYIAEESAMGGSMLALPLLKQSLLEADYSLIKVQFDASLGTVAINPLDCEGIEAPGVSFTSEDDLGQAAVTYYFSYNLPSTRVGATQAGSNAAAGGFASVAPGPHTLQMHADGNVVGTFGIGVRAGAMTVVVAVPSPAQ